MNNNQVHHRIVQSHPEPKKKRTNPNTPTQQQHTIRGQGAERCKSNEHQNKVKEIQPKKKDRSR